MKKNVTIKISILLLSFLYFTMHPAEKKFSDIPKEIQKQIYTEIFKVWSHDKPLFYLKNDPENIERITCTGPYLIINSFSESNPYLFVLNDTVYQEIKYKNEAFKEALKSRKVWASNKRYLLIVSSKNGGVGYMFDHQTHIIKKYGNLGDADIIHIIPSSCENNIFYVIRELGLRSRYVEKVNVHESMHKNSDYYVPCAERSRFPLIYANYNLKIGTMEDDVFIAGTPNDKCIKIKGDESTEQPYLSLGVTSYNTMCAILAFKCGKDAEFGVFLCKEQEFKKLGSWVPDDFDLLTFLPLKSGVFLVNKNDKSSELSFFNCDTEKKVASWNMPISIKKLWTCNDSLMVQTLNNEIIAYPSWLIEQIIRIEEK